MRYDVINTDTGAVVASVTPQAFKLKPDALFNETCMRSWLWLRATNIAEGLELANAGRAGVHCWRPNQYEVRRTA